MQQSQDVEATCLYSSHSNLCPQYDAKLRMREARSPDCERLPSSDTWLLTEEGRHDSLLGSLQVSDEAVHSPCYLDETTK